MIAMRIGIINSNTSICENVALDERSLDEIQLPAPYFALDIDSIVAVIWTYDTTPEEAYTVEVLGGGGIGFLWVGGRLLQPKPKYTP